MSEDDMGNDAKAKNMEYWQNAIKEQAENGLSVKDYCQLTEKSCHKFYYWRQRIHAKQHQTDPQSDKVEFLEVRPLSASAASIGGVDIRIGSCSLSFKNDTDQALFKKAVALLLAVQHESRLLG
jgi:ribosomal protein S17